jgi:hypothetical protein
MVEWMNKIGNNNDRFSIINVDSGRNSLDEFYCTKNYVLEDEYIFVRKSIHLLFLMRFFKHNKTCKWKRFIRRKEFVMDNPVYALKAGQCGFLFRFWLCHKFWSRKLWYLRLETVFFVGFIGTSSFVIQLVCFCSALEHLTYFHLVFPYISFTCFGH